LLVWILGTVDRLLQGAMRMIDQQDKMMRLGTEQMLLEVNAET
jgi:hypothetical protein